MKITIVIVTYNSYSLIYDCLNSIFAHNDIGDDLDVIVVDNASSDQSKTFSLIQRVFGDKNILTFNSGGNVGYGRGNNLGISKTLSEIVIVMNPDVRLVKPIFSSIVSEFNKSNIGLAGVSFVDGSLPYYFKPEYSNIYRSLLIKLYVKGNTYDSKKMYMSGSFLIFDRETFIKAGKFDEKIFMYYEEPDITNRILAVGKDVKWLKNLKVLHLAHGRKFNSHLNSIQMHSFEYYCHKYRLPIVESYKRTILLLKIKIFGALIFRKYDKKDLFECKLKACKERLKVILNN